MHRGLVNLATQFLVKCIKFPKASLLRGVLAPNLNLIDLFIISKNLILIGAISLLVSQHGGIDYFDRLRLLPLPLLAWVNQQR